MEVLMVVLEEQLQQQQHSLVIVLYAGIVSVVGGSVATYLVEIEIFLFSQSMLHIPRVPTVLCCT